MKGDCSRFVEAILADPQDTTARLVFADFLDEEGDPVSAELLRVQVEMAGEVSDQRYKELLNRARELFMSQPKWVMPPC